MVDRRTSYEDERTRAISRGREVKRVRAEKKRESFRTLENQIAAAQQAGPHAATCGCRACSN